MEKSLWESEAKRIGHYVALEEELFSLLGRLSLDQRFSPEGQILLFESSKAAGIRLQMWEAHLPHRDGVEKKSFVTLTEELRGLFAALGDADSPEAVLVFVYSQLLPAIAANYRYHRNHLHRPSEDPLERTLLLCGADLSLTEQKGEKALFSSVNEKAPATGTLQIFSEKLAQAVANGGLWTENGR